MATPARNVLFCLLLLLALGGTDTAVGAPDVAVTNGNEPIASVVNPLNPQNVVVAQCTLRVSTDFGRTFGAALNPVTPPGYPRTGIGCDDVLAFDSQGRLFWTYLLRGDINGDATPDDLTVVVVQVNPITGTAVGNAVDLSPGMFTDDKPWIAADSSLGSPYRDNLYIVWSRLNPTFLVFSRSVDQNLTWSAPQQISAAGEGFVWPSHMAVAPNGDIYASYHSDTCGATTASTFVIRDSSGGANLAAAPPVITQKTSFQSAVTCNVQTGAFAIPQTDFWMQGALAPYVVPDPVRPGHIYAIVNDDPNNTFANGDDGDVVLARSTDYGNTWSLSTISHAPAGTLQVFPNAAIDQNGRLVAFWYDTRGGQTNAGGNLLLDVYATVSTDGGNSFSNDFRINDAPFDPDIGAPCRFGCGGVGDPPPATRRIGEYNGIAAADGIAYASWTGNTFSPGGTPTGQQVYFDTFSLLGAFPDRFEPNDAIQPGVATGLGTQLAYSQPNLTIHSDTDEDFFQVVTAVSGKLNFEVSSSGRISDLDIQVRDKFNNAVATSTTAVDENNIEAISIPAVAGEPYYLRVYASPGAAPPPSPPPGALQFPPLNVYNLNIVNTAAPVPFALDLVDASDSGRNNSDDVTNVVTPTLRLRVDGTPLEGLPFSSTTDANLADDLPGFKVGVFRNGNLLGFAAPVGGQPGVYELTLPAGSPLQEGSNFLTAKVFVVDPADNPAVAGTAHAVGTGGESAALLVTLDTGRPTSPGPPNLLESSDNAGISDDNVTTISTPKFDGGGEANTLVYILANGVPVGQGTMTSGGSYEVTVNPLGDGVYDITARLEDLAGNLSDASAPLKVTIARQSITLPGNTASGGPGGEVLVDLGSGTVAGYPGIAGVSQKIGIVGIPIVNLAVNDQALTVRGTPSDDGLVFTPTGATAGTITRTGFSQVLNFTGVAGAFTVDPLGGSDTVTVNGTPAADTISAQVKAASTVQVNSLKTVTLPIAAVENLVVMAVQGVDTIDVMAFDDVNANLFVDGGEPTTNVPNGDLLVVAAGSPKGKIQKQPGGPTPGSGSFTVAYPQTTGNQTRINYSSVERTKVNH